MTLKNCISHQPPDGTDYLPVRSSLNISYRCNLHRIIKGLKQMKNPPVLMQSGRRGAGHHICPHSLEEWLQFLWDMLPTGGQV